MNIHSCNEWRARRRIWKSSKNEQNKMLYYLFLHSYALPPQNMTVQRFKPNSAVIDSEYHLTVFERNIQIQDVDAPVYPFFLRIAQAALPEGVQLTVQEHDEECEERRYVPDKDLLDLKAELERMQSDKKK